MCSRASALALVAVLACGSSTPTPAPPALGPAPATTAERVLGLLPAGVQIVIELDLARLRANPVIGRLVTRVLASDVELPAGMSAPTGSPLATATLVVMAAYGVGSAEAATLSVLAAPAPIPHTTQIADGLYAVGPEEWVAQLAQRAAITADAPVAAPAAWLELRERAMPPKAPGAALRITAELSFDARIALAHQVGLENAPARLSVWGDVVDDLAIIVDADAADPGDPRPQNATARLEATLRGALGALATLPAVRALGLPSSLAGAKLATRGSWIRTIVAIGPAHLQRVVARANLLLEPVPAPAPAPAQEKP